MLTPLVVEKLVDCCPNGDDMESIAPYDGDPALLAQVERFWYVIQDVPFFTRRMKALHLLSSWSSSLMEIVEPLEALDAACARVLLSHAFKRILAIVLELGNHMNRGTDFADAQGFKLTVLPRLFQTKSRDGKTNLLRYLLAWIRKNAPELVSLPSELRVCSVAAKVGYILDRRALPSSAVFSHDLSLKTCSTLLYSTLLYSTLLYSTLLYSTLLYPTLPYPTLPYLRRPHCQPSKHESKRSSAFLTRSSAPRRR